MGRFHPVKIRAAKPPRIVNPSPWNVLAAVIMFLTAAAVFALWAGDARGEDAPKKGTANEPTMLLLTPDGVLHPVCSFDTVVGQGSQLAEAASCTVVFRSGFELMEDEIDARMKRAKAGK